MLVHTGEKPHEWLNFYLKNYNKWSYYISYKKKSYIFLLNYKLSRYEYVGITTTMRP